MLDYLRTHASTIVKTPCSPSLDCLFTPDELLDELKLRKETAPGCDHIPVSFLVHGGIDLLTPLLALFNYSWVHGVLPVDWRSAHVTALYKGKGNPSLEINYRPVSLTVLSVRCLERLIHCRLYPHVEANHLLHPSQYGFRKGHSTQDSIFVLTERIKHVLNGGKKSAVPVAFLDLTKAYDRTWHAGLLYRLAKARITGRVWQWIRGFLHHRRFRVVDAQEKNCSDWYSLEGAAVPQGAVLGPLLWAIFIDPIFVLLDSPELKGKFATNIDLQLPATMPDPPLVPCIYPQLFADDISLLPDTRIVGWQLLFQRALDLLSTFAKEWRLKFSMDGDKSAIVYFSRMKKATLAGKEILFPVFFTLAGRLLPIVDSYCYLGLILQSSLNWNLHCQRLLKRAQSQSRRVLFILSSLDRAYDKSAKERGPVFSAVRSMVMGCLLPMCSYGIQFLTGRSIPHQLALIQSYLVLPSDEYWACRAALKHWVSWSSATVQL